MLDSIISISMRVIFRLQKYAFRSIPTCLSMCLVVTDMPCTGTVGGYNQEWGINIIFN